MKFLLAMMMVKAICFTSVEATHQVDKMSKERLKNTIQRADNVSKKGVEKRAMTPCDADCNCDVDCCDGRDCCEIFIYSAPAVCTCDNCYSCRRVKTEDIEDIKHKQRHSIRTWVVKGPDWPADQPDPGLGWIEWFREDAECPGCANVWWQRSGAGGPYYIGQRQKWHLCYDIVPNKASDRFAMTADFKDERMAGESELEESKLLREMPPKTEN